MKVWQKEYDKVLEHRKICPKWGKSFCLKCFGGGLTIWMRYIEPKIVKKSKQDLIKQIEKLNISQDINDCLVLSNDSWLDIKKLKSKENETK